MPAAKKTTGLAAAIFWPLVPILAILVGFCAICAHVLIQARSSTKELAANTAGSLIAAIKSDLSRNVETLDLSLQAVVDNLKYPGINEIESGLRQLVLFDRSATARHLGAILVIDEKGDLRIDSRTLNPPMLNLADRDYFQAHKENAALVTFIGRPTRARTSGEWFIGISRRLSHSDGSFAGVVVASLRLSYFQQLFRDAALGPDSIITLARTDGTVLMRWPYKEEFLGFDLRNAALYEHLAKSRSGVFETVSVTDGIHRLMAYSLVDGLPLVLCVGQSTDTIYAQWRQYALAVSILIALLCAMTIVLALYLVRELRKRASTEMELAALANTDALTGLSNRRHFDDILEREWQRSAQEMLPIAMLMLDVDFFKSYNDANGHQAGDALLQVLGTAIAGTLEGRAGFGARYGGDEFAVLLSRTSLVDAETVTAKLREKYFQLCEQQGLVLRGLSIGIAAVTPELGDVANGLIRSADGALYRAKQGGRNRTEVTAQALQAHTRRAA